MTLRITSRRLRIHSSLTSSRNSLQVRVCVEREMGIPPLLFSVLFMLLPAFILWVRKLKFARPYRAMWPVPHFLLKFGCNSRQSSATATTVHRCTTIFIYETTTRSLLLAPLCSPEDIMGRLDDNNQHGHIDGRVHYILAINKTLKCST